MKPAISGIGAVSALGADWPTTWKRLLTGSAELRLYDDLDPYHAAGVSVAAVEGVERAQLTAGLGPMEQIAHRALGELGSLDHVSTIFAGTNHGEMDLLLTDHPTARPLQSRLLADDPKIGDHTALEVVWHHAACASGIVALASASQEMAMGAQDVVVLAADTLSAVEVIGFRRLGALSKMDCQPFAIARDGLLIGEGAACIRLRQGDAHPGSVHLLGVSLSCDASHPTDPDPSGQWLERSIRKALETAGLQPREIAAIVCHGTGTPKNDLVEAAIIEKIWGRCGIPITSVKGSIGHTMGASGLFNVLVAVEATRSMVLPPTRNNGPVLANVDLVVGQPRSIPAGRAVLALTSGFGGNNAVALVGTAC